VQFLELNQIGDWCREHGTAVDAEWRLEPDAALPDVASIVWDPNGGADHVPVLDACLRALGDWDECLLWITVWGIWGSSEDWPRYYAARGGHGEKRNLGTAPGHLCRTGEGPSLKEFLAMALQYGWDAHVLPSRAGRIERRLNLSHDGWVELRAGVPIRDPLWDPRSIEVRSRAARRGADEQHGRGTTRDFT
jgi:hypothetical protein